MLKAWPDTLAPWGLHRKTAISATSWPDTVRLNETFESMSCSTASKVSPVASARAEITLLMRSPSTMPGCRQFTRIPKGPSSFDKDSVNPTIPHFVAAYGVRIAKPNRPATDDKLMIAPLPDSFRGGTARRRQ